MTKFTLSLLTAAAVSAMCCGETFARDLVEAANASPKVISVARSAGNSQSQRVSLRKSAKDVRSKSHRPFAKFSRSVDESIIYSCSFDFLTEGSETEPAELELDDWDNIPEELIGEENYGFGGQGLMQAGGAVYIPFEYNEDPDDEDGWYLEGMLWTPDIYEPMEVTIDLDAKIVEGCGIDTDELWVYASDYSWNFDEDSGEITTDWTHLTLRINAKDFIPESEDDSYYFTLFVDGGADIVIRNVVIRGEKAALQVPVAQEYTDFTGSSFTAHWSEVAGATGYYLNVYNFDPSTRTNTSVFLDAQFTEDNYYTVTGLTPGNFYTYQVAATDGDYTTSPSNFVIVCELPAPTGVQLSAASDNKSLNASWTATPGANYYVVTATSTVDVTAGQTVMLADADFSGVESSGTVASPEESDYWYDSRAELPGWRFNLGCSAEGAYGFWDNVQYTAMTGLLASLSSMDYDLSIAKEGKVSVTVEAASPGNGMLAGLLSFNEAQDKYDVASVYGTPGNVPEDYETYTFDLTGATNQTQFLFITHTEGTDGAILIRKLQISAEADSDGSFGMPVGSAQTAATAASIDADIQSEVTYSAVVVPYLVDDKGNILAIGRASQPATYKGELSGLSSIVAEDEASPACYYNLQGRKIVNPAKGSVVIKVTGSKASKVVF